MASLEKRNDATPYRTNPFGPMPLRVLQILLMLLIVGLSFSVLCMYAMKFFVVDHRYVPIAPSTMHACFQDTKAKRLESMDTWIRPPSNLAHPLNDTELFWRATFMPRIKDYPFKRVPKIAFMFLSKDPLPLAHLWEKFFKGHEELFSVNVQSHLINHSDFPSSSVFDKGQIPSQVKFTVPWHMSEKWEGRHRKSPNKTRRKSPEDATTSASSTIAASSLLVSSLFLIF